MIGVAAGKVSEIEVEGWIARHLTELKEKRKEDEPKT